MTKSLVERGISVVFLDGQRRYVRGELTYSRAIAGAIADRYNFGDCSHKELTVDEVATRALERAATMAGTGGGAPLAGKA